MKSICQLAAGAVAWSALWAGVLGAVLGSATAHATSLSELPLKASVLVKPNVVFAMDDSGSMDWEVLLSSNSGIAFWDGSASHDASGKPLSGTNFVPYVYLFPVGSAVGGALYAYNSYYGQTAPPIPKFAWARSARYNPLYYDSTVTYQPWSPAYVNGAQTTYAAASLTAAVSHPAVSGSPTLSIGSQWDANNGNFTSNGFRFYVQAGMVLPVGTVVNASSAGSTGTACSGNTPRTLTGTQTVPGGSACWASIPYFPATFWHPESCTANGVDCVNGPDNTTTLKRYEIRSTVTSYPSSRTYAAELQNFANWFSYHRKRKLMLAASMGKSLESITGLRLSVMPFGKTPTLVMSDSDSTDNANNRFKIAGQFYLNSMEPFGTPTHAAVKRVGTQFDTNTGIVQYACQRNSMFVVTDGFANAHSETAPSYSQTTYGNAPPYQTTVANSLADFALAYYTNRLRADLPAGKVETANPALVNADLNPNLHVTTYAITLGTRGTLYQSAANPFAAPIFTSPPTWPTPVGDDPSMIDDLWHATVNGRGKMYLATDTTGTSNAIQSALNEILTQVGAQAGVGVSNVNLDRGDGFAYLGSYNPGGWSGNLTANRIDPTTAVVSLTPTWNAAELLAARDWNTRTVFTASGGSGIDFSTPLVGTLVNPDALSFTDQAVVEYLRGNRAGEGATLRTRAALLGAVVNAEPVLARDESVVYLASGEGMLHAFDTADGKEQWAFAPPDTLPSIGKSIKRGWVYQTLLDATPTYARLASGNKLLVGGLGAAGRSYYALDVTAPRNLTAAQAQAQFRWIFPATSDSTTRAKMGYTVGKPVIASTATDGDVVLVTSGYDNGVSVGDGKGRLWVLNATTGAVIKTFRTTLGSTTAEAGLAHVSAFKEGDGTVRYAYGGDLLGNVWRFDLARTGGGELDAELLASLQDGSGNTQPVTSAPELATVEGKRVVLVGTGRILDIGDFGSARTQSFYAITDPNTLSTLANARNSLVRQVYTQSSASITANAINWGTQRGWYFDLPAGEQANTDPIVAYGAVAFATNTNGASDCSQSSTMYLLGIGTGSTVPGAPTASQLISNTANSSRLIIVRTENGELHGIAHKSDNSIFPPKLPLGVTINPAKNAWKEIRR